MQADVYGLPVHTMAVDEGAAYGAALLGGVTAGLFGSVAEASAEVRTTAAYEPDRERAGVYEEAYRIYRDLYPALSRDMHRLSDLAEAE
jgi:xylulokinase